MDVDCTIVGLKRSNSAPMINKISATMSVTSPSATTPRDVPSNFNIFSNSPRVRRFSTSSSGTVPRLTPRVSQLRQEECIDVAGREAAHEKEIHSAMQISQSWEDLTIEAEGLSFKDSESTSLQFKIESRPIAKRVLDPLNINLSVNGQTTYSSPSPTRSNFGQRQCYSPGVHAVTWKNNLSPSPTRKAFATRRSLSPIAIRPSCLASVKRKFELDDSGMDQLQPPTKRNSGLLTSATSRLDVAISSLHPTINSAGTPESCSSLDSSGFSFRPVDSPSPGLAVTSSFNDEPSSSSSSSSSSSTSSSCSSSSVTASSEGLGTQNKSFIGSRNEQIVRENHG